MYRWTCAVFAVASVVLAATGSVQADDAATETPGGATKPDFARSVPGWVYNANAQCWAFDETNHYSARFTWTGNCTDGQISGDGTLTWTVYGDSKRTVTGKFERGVLNGAGQATWSSGARYDGTFKDSLLDGSGTMRWTSGDHYEGHYSRGKFDGEGHLFMAESRTQNENSQYDGGFKNGGYDGQGVLVLGDSRFEGEFRDGSLFDGRVHLVSADGTHYDGPYKNGKAEGIGSLTFISGVYQGEFHNGGMSGKGVLHRPDGTILEGDVQDAHEDSPVPVRTQYPPASIRYGEEGNVVVTYLIQTDGQVADIKIVKSSGYERLDKVATDTVAALHFSPARIAGTAIVIKRTRSFKFRFSS